MNPALQRLRAEIRFDREAFGRLVAELRAIEIGPGVGLAPQRAQAAVALHHAYGSVESIMARVSRYLEGDVLQGPDWHQALLHAMSLDVEGVRPAVFSPASAEVLRRVLGFRHFFRHAYAVELDAARLAGLRDELVNAAPRIAAEIETLETFLAQVAASD